MQLNEEQKSKMLKRLDEVWGAEQVCAVCQHNEWEVYDTIFEVREFAGGSINVRGVILPFVVVTCKHCSNTLFFNAIKLGVVLPPEEEKKGEKETV